MDNTAIHNNPGSLSKIKLRTRKSFMIEKNLNNGKNNFKNLRMISLLN